MRASRSLSALYLLVGAAGCSEANQQNYKYAAVGTGALIAAVGIHRAITNDCWARCSPGYLCNEESGLCERGECLPGCEVGSHCVRSVTGQFFCVHDATGTATRTSLSANAPRALDAGVATDAGASDAGTTDAATSNSPDAATDASSDASESFP